jgi:Spy/CpxP family protein refolding chaperone
MKHLRSSIFAILLVLTMAAGASAQPATTQESDGRDRPRRGMQMQMPMVQLLDELDLSEEQRAKIDEILADAQKERESLRDELRQLEPRERRERMQQHMESLREKINAELTEEQRAALEEKTQQQQERWRERMGRRGGGGDGPATRPGPGAGAGFRGFGGPDQVDRLTEALTQLDLTDEQQQKIADALDELRDSMDQLRGQEGNWEARRDAMQKFQQAVQETLTEEQRAKLRELTPERGRGGRGEGDRGPGRRGGGRRGGGNQAPAEPL